jgi:hypothetical protein
LVVALILIVPVAGRGRLIPTMIRRGRLDQMVCMTMGIPTSRRRAKRRGRIIQLLIVRG